MKKDDLTIEEQLNSTFFKIKFQRWPDLSKIFDRTNLDEFTRPFWDKMVTLYGKGDIGKLQAIHSQLTEKRNQAESDLEVIKGEGRIKDYWRRRIQDSLIIINKKIADVDKLLTGLAVYGGKTGDAFSDPKTVSDSNTVSVDEIIDLAIKPLRKKNKESGRKFMHKYYHQKESNSGFNHTDLIGEINWTEHSSNTQRDWMEKFDEAEKLLSNSNQ